MRSINTFRRGGISLPAGHKKQENLQLRNAYLPHEALIPLTSATGKPPRILTSKGAFVTEGAVIARGRDSLCIHSSIPGIVCGFHEITAPNGSTTQAALIRLEGGFDLLKYPIAPSVWNSLSNIEIMQRIQSGGVIDPDSFCTPLAKLLSEYHELGMLILNGVETEPFLLSERCILNTYPEQVLEGLGIVAKLCHAQATLVAVVHNLHSKIIENALAKDIEVIEMHNRYPQELPNQINQVIPKSSKATADTRLLLKPSTALAVYEAVVLRKPMLERVITISGSAVKNRAVLKARIGTSIKDLINECGGFSAKPERIVISSSMRGHAIANLDTPVFKNTSAILALTKAECKTGHQSECIRCGDCMRVCPEKLDPELLYRMLLVGHGMEADRAGLQRCTQCGLCSYICPSRIPLTSEFAGNIHPKLEAINE